MSLRTVLFVVVGAILLAGSAWAHHNMTAIFDFNDRVMLSGTLTKVDWRNPHIELVVDAKSGDQVQSWSLEGPPPSFFRARDINRSDVEAALGKTITAEASRARDHSRSGLLRVKQLPMTHPIKGDST
ncbi:MAG: hypothetical protein DMG12_08350 [Acidobacteria bacterium]|nr:MAG: hypothetical protein DMG12_08350 [Acidobacteriota bacterium]